MLFYILYLTCRHIEGIRCFSVMGSRLEHQRKQHSWIYTALMIRGKDASTRVYLPSESCPVAIILPLSSSIVLLRRSPSIYCTYILTGAAIRYRTPPSIELEAQDELWWPNDQTDYQRKTESVWGSFHRQQTNLLFNPP